jgi:hypothetical protein
MEVGHHGSITNGLTIAAQERLWRLLGSKAFHHVRHHHPALLLGTGELQRRKEQLASSTNGCGGQNHQVEHDLHLGNSHNEKWFFELKFR